jgi:hypothetical protein
MEPPQRLFYDIEKLDGGGTRDQAGSVSSRTRVFPCGLRARRGNFGNLASRSALVRRNERALIAGDEAVSLRARRIHPGLRYERSDMNVHNIEGLMRAMELEGTARIDIIRIGKDIQTAGYARRSPSVQQYEELRRAVVQWQRIADDIGKIMGSG